MIRRVFVVLLAALALAGCGARKQAKLYDMQGEIKAVDPAAKTATIQHGKIGDWMEPMTMDYKVKPDSEFQKLRVGDHIQAKVVVEDPDYYVTSVQIVKQGP
jgi:Cu/Ag efflux protein CusF